MGTSQHVVWLDEESPQQVFSEAITRTLDVKGVLMNTFTPLLGTTDVVQHFLNGGPGIFVKNVTWDDAPHLEENEKERLKLSYFEWERDARTKGLPMMGSGAVYPVKDDDILVEPFEIPRHYYRICGIDFGIDHPAAAVWMAWDKDSDVVFIYDCYRRANKTYVYHASAIKQRGDWIPVAWPHDGMDRDKGSKRAIPLYRKYKEEGVMMLPRSSRYQEKTGGAQPVEPIVIDILERMVTGRLKIFSNLTHWWEEKRMYHRKDGQIVAERDDLMAATRYGMMDLRKARVNIATSHRHSPPSILTGLHGA